MKHPQFKCNGCGRKTEFLWLDQWDTPDGFKVYQCMDCGCVGVKNIAEAVRYQTRIYLDVISVVVGSLLPWSATLVS